MIIIQIPPCVHSSVNRRWYWLSSALPGTASNWRRSFIRWTFFSPRLFKAPASCSRALSTCRLSWSWFAGASSSRLLRALNEQRGFSIIDIYTGKNVGILTRYAIGALLIPLCIYSWIASAAHLLIRWDLSSDPALPRSYTHTQKMMLTLGYTRHWVEFFTVDSRRFPRLRAISSVATKPLRMPPVGRV